MKRKMTTMGITVAVMLVTLFVQLVTEGETERVSGRNGQVPIGAEYAIEARLDTDQMLIDATQQVVVTNLEAVEFTELYFHIYPNVFQKQETVPFSAEEMASVYYKGFQPGGLTLGSVKEKQRSLEYKVMGKTNTLLRITLAEPLAPGRQTTLTFEFQVALAPVVGRTGYGPDTVNISKWYPILAVYDERGWNLDPYYAIGDPFYSRIGNYQVRFTFPEQYVVAHTGSLVKEQQRRGEMTYQISAEQVRDFALVLSTRFIQDFGLVEGTEIRTYHLDEAKRREALQYGMDALEIFNRRFGPYPYPQLSIVACDFHLGGMEFPNLVMISKDLYQFEEDFPLEYVVVHEIAHQWWYGLVGNNEVQEPWLDEALTEYATLLYFEDKYGPHIKEQVMEKVIKAQYDAFAEIHREEEGIFQALTEFDTPWAYSSIVYSKGALFMEALRREMGEEAFFAALQAYFSEFQYDIATTTDFYEICRQHTEKELSEIFESWLKVKFE